MAVRDLSLPLRFPNWQREYESALLETDKSVAVQARGSGGGGTLLVVMRWSTIRVVRQSEARLKTP